MNTSRRPIPRNLLLGAVLASGIMACGQRGPLVLPEKARPIERIELPQPQPQAEPPAEQEEEQQKNEP